MEEQVILVEQYIFTREDGSQVLVDIWSNGATMAERAQKGDTWGPPVDGVKA